MKVQITKEAKKWLTLEMAPKARQIIMDMKDPENGYGSEEEALMSAARGYYNYGFYHFGGTPDRKWELGCPVRVPEAKAEIAGNQRVYDYYGEGTRTLDVWVSGLVLFDRGVLEIHSYLTDIWALGPDDANRTLAERSYIREFVEKKQ